eukprot:CAMPEP_0118924476 /NCGR_PEP_ID=MMETSP1169-20130426/2592_1 /TAXON_ID=36882 /ORGANISM="Pyramimonas obovata, Strain CCMP722" /LENGTH=254 /DNA_ID=CAMNT_0006865595 /DNA_START=270 /DNA_END=1035 /DNA_ORIENTATION=-
MRTLANVAVTALSLECVCVAAPTSVAAAREHIWPTEALLYLVGGRDLATKFVGRNLIIVPHRDLNGLGPTPLLEVLALLPSLLLAEVDLPLEVEVGGGAVEGGGAPTLAVEEHRVQRHPVRLCPQDHVRVLVQQQDRVILGQKPPQRHEDGDCVLDVDHLREDGDDVVHVLCFGQQVFQLLGGLEETVLILQEGPRALDEEQWNVDPREACFKNDNPPPHTVTVYSHLNVIRQLQFIQRWGKVQKQTVELLALV